MDAVNWNELEWDDVMPGMKRKVVHADGFTIVLVSLDPNTDLAVHAHPHSQATIVKQGSLEFNVAGSGRVITEGDVVRIPANAEHGGKTLDAPVLVYDLFCPNRDEFPASKPKA